MYREKKKNENKRKRNVRRARNVNGDFRLAKRDTHVLCVFFFLAFAGDKPIFRTNYTKREEKKTSYFIAEPPTRRFRFILSTRGR